VIASLRGVLTEKEAGLCVIEAGGVGYLVHVSSYTAQALPARGAEVSLRTRQVVREDALTLFGFSDSAELKLFDLLIGVSGVGPRLALALLSGLRPPVLARAIREEQIGPLIAVPGIGRKTAERLIVELRDKLEVPVGAKEAPVLPRSERFQDAVAALTRLGYTAPQAQEAVRKASESEDDLSLEELVRKALARLGKSAGQPLERVRPGTHR
jgi:Holliday junction DNA helicase RuvA